ncbi:hypothetical protein PMPD1_0839 [Paramixta manurensis]|uniref:DUF3592 domain-containing protein n=1 Tax=Paramixta manurensis TaxID=2740817 RepID=A0A6M8UDR1_9GAMM|nr:hypothetical protein PMPD1_0839 [Erwiniaceae bacterium PD-1]
MLSVILCFLGASAMAMVFLILFIFLRGSYYDKFKQEGVRTKAEIINIQQVASSGSGSPVCIFTLSFSTTSHEKINTTVKQTVSLLPLMQMERVKKTYIYYLPNRPDKVLIDSTTEE